jgi:hypothetical protein
MGSFQDSVDRFEKAAIWLDETDEPALTTLREAAKHLDGNGISAAVLNVFTVTHRALQKKGQKGTEGFDEDEAFLSDL